MSKKDKNNEYNDSNDHKNLEKEIVISRRKFLFAAIFIPVALITIPEPVEARNIFDIFLRPRYPRYRRVTRSRGRSSRRRHSSRRVNSTRRGRVGRSSGSGSGTSSNRAKPKSLD